MFALIVGCFASTISVFQIALSPTGRVLFLSRHPQMLGIAVCTIKYLVELRGWNGIALPMIHSRDAKIYMDVRFFTTYGLRDGY
jgi:uncharacterized membrane protein